MQKPSSVSLKPAKRAVRRRVSFDLQGFLGLPGVAREISQYARTAIIYAQGEPATGVHYIQQGAVKLSVLSKSGKEAVVCLLVKGDFFGEACLAGQPRRMSTALSLTASTVLQVETPKMTEMLHKHPALADRFLSHMLARNIRIEEDLVDQLFNSSEKRLARALLLLANYGKDDEQLELPKLSQETLAEMVGTTRSRVNFFMNKFRNLGYIEYNGTIKVNGSLLNVVLHD